ncbi:hypothetical protein MA20_42605 [Bradyrhizobium japonicum]|uniref:Uncharacterized protein n=1 Tax=Bradyrhizobium japonicum TaxID=375 RepID=A0A0A3XKR6_BRAJP|nr:hypothetical protein [Bradyrhizobium japonicum]KGT73756.1 hypothetical protein MA20_42605 [Bradyrhizobium japonicum]
MLKENWRVILVTLLAANLVFMSLLELQRLAIWRTEQAYFTQIQQPSTERFDFLAKELAEAKTSETKYLDLIYRGLAELNMRVTRVEKATEETPANVSETRAIRADVDALKAAVERTAVKP